MLVKLSKPIKPGFRRPVTLRPDAPVDVLGDGAFAIATITQGDSTVTYRPESSATEIKLYVNGDGALGSKEVQVRVDGHVGEGDAVLTLDIAWEVSPPNATMFTVAEEEEDEPIPAV